MTMTTLVELNGIEKRFDKPLFSPVSFTLLSGEGLALSGRNGSGKTTLLDIIAGLKRPDKGSVCINGPIGYVMQNDGLDGLLSCRDNLRYEAALCRLSAAESRQKITLLAELCGVTSFLNKRLSKCSAGMRQRVAIAAALISDPKVLLLDEAFSSLDAQSAAAMKEVLISLMGEGACVIFATHIPGESDGLCSRTLVLPDAVLV